MEKVKENEIFALDGQESDTLEYVGTLLNIPCYLTYKFNANKLIACTFWSIYDDRLNELDWMVRYCSLLEHFTPKYGKPTYNKIIIIDKDRSRTGLWMADLSAGIIQYITTWDTQRTHITLVMRLFEPTNSPAIMVDFVEQNTWKDSLKNGS